MIHVSGNGARQFSCLMVKTNPDFQTVFNGQGFPLKVFIDSNTAGTSDLFNQSPSKQKSSKNNITNEFIDHACKKYNQSTISSEDIFSYTYGVLHSPEYREKFKNNFSKELPRIPLVANFEKFKFFVSVGKSLAYLHTEFESVQQFDVVLNSQQELLEDSKNNNKFYRVHKMRFAGIRGSEDKTTVIYNEHITIKNIPLEAYEYVVNGKPALEWVMERQSVKVDKDSGIVNDANDYAIETMNNPAYPLELFQRVITVSLETIKIVKSLPPLDLN